LDTSNVRNMYRMFSGCSSLISVPFWSKLTPTQQEESFWPLFKKIKEFKPHIQQKIIDSGFNTKLIQALVKLYT